MKMTVEAGGIEGAVEDNQKQLTSKPARRWFTLSQDMLLDRGEDYPGEADQAEVHGIVQSGHPPEWTGERWEFYFSHLAAPFFEFGTEPHTIEARDGGFLKFPWPNAPEGVKERFRPQWEDPSHFLEEPEVLMKSVEHPGTPELRFLRDSMLEVAD